MYLTPNRSPTLRTPPSNLLARRSPLDKLGGRMGSASSSPPAGRKLGAAHQRSPAAPVAWA
eukprot:6559100-Alexandrium_andersonii.AAC.1